MNFLDHFLRNLSLLLRHVEAVIVSEWVCIMHFPNSFSMLGLKVVLPRLDHISIAFVLVSPGFEEKEVRQRGKVEDGVNRSAETCDSAWGVWCYRG